MSKPSKKMELPSITKQRNEAWSEAEALYTEAYNNLTTAIKGVGVIVSRHKEFGDHVDIQKVTKMVNGINNDTNQLRNELNQIHIDMQEAKNKSSSLPDVNMYSIVHASRIEEWSNKYKDNLLTQLNDLTDYIENVTPNQ